MQLPTQVDSLRIRIEFISHPVEPPLEVWSSSSEPAELQIDEQALDKSLAGLSESGDFLLRRSYIAGGWGATGLTVIDVVLSVGVGLATNATYDALKALYRKFTGQTPEVFRERPRRKVRRASEMKRSRKKPARKSRRRR